MITCVMHRCILTGKIEINNSIDNKPMNDASAKNAEASTCKVFRISITVRSMRILTVRVSTVWVMDATI